MIVTFWVDDKTFDLEQEFQTLQDSMDKLESFIVKEGGDEHKKGSTKKSSQPEEEEQKTETDVAELRRKNSRKKTSIEE